jgi:hypothetical protein
MNLGPSEAQSESIKHTFEHALPAELHPPSVKTARSRHAPEVHSLSVEQVALAGLSLALVALAQATAAMTPNRITQRVFTEGLDSRECAAQKSRDSGGPFSGENPRSRIARVQGGIAPDGALCFVCTLVATELHAEPGSTGGRARQRPVTERWASSSTTFTLVIPERGLLGTGWRDVRRRPRRSLERDRSLAHAHALAASGAARRARRRRRSSSGRQSRTQRERGRSPSPRDRSEVGVRDRGAARSYLRHRQWRATTRSEREARD